LEDPFTGELGAQNLIQVKRYLQEVIQPVAKVTSRRRLRSSSSSALLRHTTITERLPSLCLVLGMIYQTSWPIVVIARYRNLKKFQSIVLTT